MRFAAIDVLVAQDVPIEIAPVCRMDGGSVACTGSTTSGDTISVTSPAEASDTLEVKVGDTVLYSGTITDVIDDAIRPGA